MDLLLKVGDKRFPNDTNYQQALLDGQPIDMRHTGYYKNHTSMLKQMCIVRVPQDYWTVRGSTDWKDERQSVLNLKKFLTPADINGKYPWEFGYLQEEKRIRYRDWFIDYQALLNGGLITQSDYDSLYDFDRVSNILVINRDFITVLKHEEGETRIKPFIKNMAVSSGTYTIGAAGDYSDLTAAVADIADPLTGNLTFNHLDEETTISTTVTVDTDTASYLLKITAQSGAEHDGTAYGNGARINFGTADSIQFDETTPGDLDDIEISKLALDIKGNNNLGVHLIDGADSGVFTVNRMLIEGDVDSTKGVHQFNNVENVLITNNIVYGLTGTGGDGIAFFMEPKGPISGTHEWYNNTAIKNNNGFVQSDNTLNVTLNFKNNMCQGNAVNDYNNAGGAGFGTTAKNISEDATSPDASYQSKDLHTNTIFNDYVNDDYTLDSGGDATNLAIADDGEDLSGIFTEDIIGQTRSTWYIGASEIAAAPTGAISSNMMLLGVG